MSVSRETQMRRYADMLLEWNEKIRLVGREIDAGTVMTELDDCLAPEPFLDPAPFVDFGSGGGLPGLPLAIANPERPVTLVEADRRKAAFLTAVRRDLQLANVTVRPSRIEALPPLGAAQIVARAFAPLIRILDHALPHLADGGRLLLLKGRKVEEEVREAGRRFTFRHAIHPLGAARGCVLAVSDLGPRP